MDSNIWDSALYRFNACVVNVIFTGGHYCHVMDFCSKLYSTTTHDQYQHHMLTTPMCNLDHVIMMHICVYILYYAYIYMFISFTVPKHYIIGKYLGVPLSTTQTPTYLDCLIILKYFCCVPTYFGAYLCVGRKVVDLSTYLST